MSEDLKMLLAPAAAAARLGVAKQTLAVWRLKGCGPSYVKLGRKVAYSTDALERYIAEQTFQSTNQYSAD